MAADPIKVLLIEDNPGDARLVREALAETKVSLFQLAWVTDLAQGLAHLAKDPVDVILLDLTLPDSSGIETFTRLHHQAPQIPAILLTGLNDEELATETVRQGAQDFLVKGWVDAGLLARSIRYAIGRKEAEKALLLMAETQRVIVHQESIHDLCKIVGQKIQELIGDGYVIVSILDETIQAIKVAGLYGFGKIYDDLARQFKIDPLNSPYYLKDMTEAELKLFRSGKLERFTGGLYHAMLRKIPRIICQAAEAQLKITGIYTMGFAWHELHFGGIFILAKHDLTPFTELIETIVNQATISIKRIRSEADVRLLNEELEARVQERTTELEAANQELESFSYSVSHDLRAPLRHINGFVNLLKERLGPTLDAESREDLETVENSTIHMGNLIDDLLSFSRMGRQEMQKTKFELDGLVREVIAELEVETKSRVIEWLIAELPAVTADRALLKMALINLLSNAVKYTRPRQDARIEIASQPGKKNETIVLVRDNGVGFDMKYVDKLFNVFQRLHRVDEFEGTGIGLANVRRIISRHGGRVWAEGKIDEGATFYFTLPKQGK